MEKSSWVAARWLDTYLMPSSPVSSKMEQAFGASGNGPSVARRLLTVLQTLLWGIEWQGEVDLHRILIVRLLASFTKRTAVCRVLLASPEWHDLLVGTFPQPSQPQHCSQFSGSFHRSACTSLTRMNCPWLSN